VERARCEVAEVFTIKLKKKESIIPGIKVTSGKLTKKCKVYIFREGIPVSAGLDISFIKSFKKEMLELKKGEEGTIGFVQEDVNVQKGDELVFN
jgi:translation initiation factor IF-2